MLRTPHRAQDAFKKRNTGKEKLPVMTGKARGIRSKTGLPSGAQACYNVEKSVFLEDGA